MKRSMMPRMGERFFGYALLAPTLALLAVVILYPLANGIRISLLRYKLTSAAEPHWIGLANYRKLFQDDEFWDVARTTVIWTASNVIAQLVLGLALALLMNEQLKARGLFRSMALIPYIVPSVCAALIWRWMYDGSSGIINAGLYRLGLIDSYRPWLGEVGTALPGFYDLAGNVHEWTTSEPCSYAPPGTDLTCSSAGRVVRGGSGFDTDGRVLRSTVRLANAKDGSSINGTFTNSWFRNVGFRCFATATPSGSCVIP